MSKPAPKRLVNAAKKAARAAGRAAKANSEWVRLFEKEYGHSDISDALVEIIDYSKRALNFNALFLLYTHAIFTIRRRI